jgi:hypothetical protein
MESVLRGLSLTEKIGPEDKLRAVSLILSKTSSIRDEEVGGILTLAWSWFQV